MDIKQLATAPQLVKITLDSEDIVNKYGEPLEFWIWDKQPLQKFVRFANANEADPGELIEFTSELILDSEGNPVMSDGTVLPPDVLGAAITKVVEHLGK